MPQRDTRLLVHDWRLAATQQEVRRHEREPIEFDTSFADETHLVIPADAAARIAEHLGRAPRAGDKIHVELTPTTSRPYRSSRGMLADRRERIASVDIAAVRREIAVDLSGQP